MNYLDIYNILINNTYIYERCGHDRREMTFLRNGSIGSGRATMESSWKLEIKDKPILTISSPNNESFELTLMDHGTWHGNWPFHERMSIVLMPKSLYKKDFYEDVTFIIQGPLHPNSIQNLKNYTKFGNVIISCWECDDIKLLDKVNLSYLLVRNAFPIAPLYNSANIHFQLVSTINALKYCNTKYCIKLRSDEAYSDLRPIIEKLRSNPDKVISSTVYFCNRPYHPSDHIIAAKTSVLFNGFNEALRLITELYNPLEELRIVFTSERIICFGILFGLKEDPRIDNWVQLMHKYYDIVPMSQLGDIIWRCNGMGVESNLDNFNNFSGGHCATIHDMKQLGVNPYLN